MFALAAVSVCSGCYTECHKLGGLNHRNLFLTGLEAGKFKIKAPADSVSGENSLPGSQMAIFFLCPPMVEGTWELSGVSFIGC